MSDLSHCPVVILLFAMDGCPHCDDFSPRFERMVGAFQAKGWPFVFYDERRVVQYGQIPILVLDGASEDPSIGEIADQHAIEGMPTTLVLRRFGPPLKLEGAVDDRELYDALVAACEANR
jgi:thiol-disulfide isomerase/thioredoxin